MSLPHPLHDRLRARTPVGTPDLSALADDAMLSSLLDHRSVRAFAEGDVAAVDLDGAIAAAQSAATSSNLQCFSVVAVRDPALRARYAELAGGQAHVRDAPLLLLWVLDLSRLRRMGEASGQPTEALDWLEMFVVGAVDVALGAQNAAAFLEHRGYGTCYIGGMRNHPEQVADLAGLPPLAMVLFGMTVGIPDPAQRPDIKPRLPPSVVLHHDRYDPVGEADAIAAYGRAAAEASAAAGRPARDWSEDAIRRVAGPQTLSGRDRLRAALDALGFALR
jgi:nitroreductase